jgi:WD40 repeat protein
MKVTQVYEGHFDEITKLAVVGTSIISASLDGTIRTWDTREAPKKLEIAKVEEPKKSSSGLTEEEERELAELMGEDDD